MQHIKMILDWIAGLSPDSPEDRCLVKARLRYHAFAFVMLVSAGLSGVGAAYLVFYVFGSVGVSLAAGAFWAAGIFLVERFLVLSMDDTLTPRNVFFGLLRVGFAFLAASTIVIPLELRFFETSVVNRISAKATDETNDAANELKAFYAPEREELGERKAALQTVVTDKRAGCDAVYAKWHGEIRGVAGEGTSGKEGIGKWANLAEQEYHRCEEAFGKLVAETAPKTAEIDGRLEQIQRDYDRRYAARVERINGATGLLDRIEAFEAILREHPTLWNKTTMIWLLLCVFESLPVLGKLMFPRRLSREESEALEDLIARRKMDRDLALLRHITEVKTAAKMLLHSEKLAAQGAVETLDRAAARYQQGGPSAKEYEELLAARISELGAYRTVETGLQD
ncbi:MAG: DUF4407 domain-containing protein [Acidobacteria bacterium]|nr:DUF4407 domain-containing protein [Acidobacteriota bacterium]